MARESFTVLVTYDVTTPESVDAGEFADIGTYRASDTATLREAFYTLGAFGPYDSAEVRGGRLVAVEADGLTNYRTGAVTRRTVHVDGSPRDIARLVKWAKLPV